MVPRYCAQRNAVHCSGVSRGLHSTGVTVSHAHEVNDVGLCIAVYDTLMAWWYNRCPLYLISGWQTFSLGDGMPEMGVRVN